MNEPSNEEKAEIYFKAVADCMSILEKPICEKLEEVSFGQDVPAGLAVSAVVQAMILIGIGIGREQRLPTLVLVETLEQTLKWVKDPTHIFGQDTSGPEEFVEEIVPPAPKA